MCTGCVFKGQDWLWSIDNNNKKCRLRDSDPVRRCNILNQSVPEIDNRANYGLRNYLYCRNTIAKPPFMCSIKLINILCNVCTYQP